MNGVCVGKMYIFFMYEYKYINIYISRVVFVVILSETLKHNGYTG